MLGNVKAPYTHTHTPKHKTFAPIGLGIWSLVLGTAVVLATKINAYANLPKDQGERRVIAGWMDKPRGGPTSETSVRHMMTKTIFAFFLFD